MPRTGLTAEELRQQAVQSAMDRMRRDGVGSVKLVDVARDIGVSHAALYAHFANKEALLDSVSEEWLNELDDNLVHICRGVGSARERLESVCIFLHASKCERVSREPELYKAFSAVVSHAKPFVVRHMETMRVLVCGLVEDGIQDGSLPVRVGINAADAASLLLNGLAAFHHPALVAERNGVRQDTTLLALIDVMVRGLAPL